MAARRMISKMIIDTDAFLDMPLSAQALYFHLNLRADDDGFVGNPKRIRALVGASEDDLKILIGKKFLLNYETGVIVIKHWRMHNTIRKDRYTETVYLEEKSMLNIKDNNAYSFSSGTPVLTKNDEKFIENTGENALETEWQPDGDILETQVRLGKDSIGKVSIGKDKKKTATRYFDSDNLNTAFLKFIEMRKKIKSPMTEHAIDLAVKELSKLAEIPFSDEINEDVAVEIINTSIMNGWKGLFPLKQKTITQPGNKSIMEQWRDA